MLEQGIEETFLIKSLGLFFVVLVMLLFIILIYFLLKLCNCCTKVRKYLQSKIFYSGPLRYVIVGYIRILN